MSIPAGHGAAAAHPDGVSGDICRALATLNGWTLNRIGAMLIVPPGSGFPVR